MKRFVSQSLGLGLLCWLGWASSAAAIPGNLVRNVEVWMQSHPTLRPAPGERLVINRADTPARRFTFRASIFPVTGLTPDVSLSDVVRTEQITLVDTIDGISANRLEESLRTIYDALIYNDYRRAMVVYRYPTSSLTTGTGTLSQGELREGDRFAYWLHLNATPDGFIPSGTMTIFLKEDLPALQADLANR